MAAAPETESGETPFPGTLTVHNPTETGLQYTTVKCERVRRVRLDPENVLVADVAASACDTTLQFVEPALRLARATGWSLASRA